MRYLLRSLAALALLAAVSVAAVPAALAADTSVNTTGDIFFEPSVYFPGLDNMPGSQEYERNGAKAYRIRVTPTTLGEYIVILYKFFTGATAIIAMFMVTYGGLLWLLAGGNQGSISNAKEIITGAVAGMVIALLSYALLATISRGLVEFKSLNTTLRGAAPTSTDLGCEQGGFSKLESSNILELSSGASYPCALSDTVDRLNDVADVVRTLSGSRVLVTSAYRSKTRQQELFRQNCATCIEQHPNDWQTVCTSSMCSPHTCNPWSSSGCPHTSGAAVDVRCSSDPDGTGDCQLELERTMLTHSFCRLKSESWHFEYPFISSNCRDDYPDRVTGERSGCNDCCNSKTGALCSQSEGSGN